MGNENVKLHARQNLGEGQIYNYRFDATNGMDVRLLNCQGNSHKVALIENMIRNKKSAAPLTRTHQICYKPIGFPKFLRTSVHVFSVPLLHKTL